MQQPATTTTTTKEDKWTLESVKNKSSLAYGLSVGFLMWNPFVWLIQIPLFVGLLLIFIYAAHVSVGWSFLAAYIIQGVIIAVLHYFGFKYLFIGKYLKL